VEYLAAHKAATTGHWDARTVKNRLTLDFFCSLLCRFPPAPGAVVCGHAAASKIVIIVNVMRK
jgi:hypothetical protein